MTRVIDGVIKEWGELTYYGKPQSRRSKNIQGGKSIFKKPSVPKKTARGRLKDTVRRTPEVMVKITGKPRNMAQVAANFEYISREGDLELEDDKGDVYVGREDIDELQENWRDEGYRIPADGGKKREAYNVILSMPPGTDRTSLKNAARDFAGDVFDRHQYVFAAHSDEKHPHVHLTVKAVDRDGRRLDPRKADLQHWREMFAEKLNEHGIEANATARRTRGVDRRAVKQAVRHIDARAGTQKATGERYELSKLTERQRSDAKREASGGPSRRHPAYDRLATARQVERARFGKLAKTLARGDREDKELALAVTQFVATQPPAGTLHRSLVTRERAAQSRGVNRTPDRDNQRGDRSPDRQ